VNLRISAVYLVIVLGCVLCAFRSVAQTADQNQNATQASNHETPPQALTPEQYAKAKNYSRTRYTQYFVGEAYTFLVLLLLLVRKFGSRLQTLAERVTSRRVLQILVFAPLFILTLSVLLLPIDLWSHSVVLRYGLSVQSWGSWISDWITAGVLALLLGTLLIWILYAVIRRSPRRWWFYFWLASLPVILLVLFVSPVIIDPLFFRFEPLQPKNPELVREIDHVVQRAGLNIPSDRMFVMNASSKYTGLNAFVEGFGSTKRVVVWDTMLQKSTIPETMVVFGHEMGHYVLLHIPKQIVIDSLIVLVLLYAGFRIIESQVKSGRWKITSEAELASLPLLLLVFSVLGFLATPVFSGISRHFEHEADRYALEVTHGIVPDSSQAGVRFFEISGVTNLSDPDPSPFIVFWLFDHPSDPDRIQFMKNYDPWSNGRSPRYVK
jgi:STE24 endopeptidase